MATVDSRAPRSLYPVRVIAQVIIVAVATKGAIISFTLYMVLGDRGLTEFQKALIIATVSAVVTGVFTILAAWVTVRFTRPVHDNVIDIKRKVEADRRAEDP